MSTTKIAAFVGNCHASARVTAFFDTHAEARAAAAKSGHQSTWTRPVANWVEHMRWNTERVGMYKDMPVAE